MDMLTMPEQCPHSKDIYPCLSVAATSNTEIIKHHLSNKFIPIYIISVVLQCKMHTEHVLKLLTFNNVQTYFPLLA